MSLVYTAPAAGNTASSGGGNSRRNSVYIGGKKEAKSLEMLQQRGISRILNVTPAKETSIQAGVPNYFEKSGKFVYRRIPVYDAATSTTTLEEKSEEIVSFISSGLFHGSVLVHCRHGVSRSTTCVVMYLMRKLEMSLADAMTLVQRRRPQAQPIPAFMQLLERYEKQCEQSRRSSKSTSSSRPAKKARVVATTMGPSSVVGLDGPDADAARGSTIGSAKPKDPTNRITVGPSRGPAMIGPSRGPDAARGSTIGSAEPKDPTNRITVGPSRGPAMIGPSRGPPSSAFAGGGATTTTTSDAPVPVPSIGPMMPPSESSTGINDATTIKTTGSSAGSMDKTLVIGPSIGPSMPESLVLLVKKKQPSNEETESEKNLDASSSGT